MYLCSSDLLQNKQEYHPLEIQLTIELNMATASPVHRNKWIAAIVYEAK